MTTTTDNQDAIGARSAAVGELVDAAARFGGERAVALNLHMHKLTRAQFDGFDGDEKHFPRDKDREHEFWSKPVVFCPWQHVDGMMWGSVTLTLFTVEAPR